jgi:hypothetical protein
MCSLIRNRFVLSPIRLKVICCDGFSLSFICPLLAATVADDDDAVVGLALFYSRGKK